ncbi:MAG: hypothetical protein OEZ13_11950 [Spirochaetia bacterium]|nr:hypothetical protein [Spirochaetia bacterium]
MISEKIWVLLADKKEVPDYNELKKKINCYLTGIGLFESYYNFLSLIKNGEKKPQKVILLGTAGSVKKEDIFSLCISNEFGLLPSSSVDVPEFIRQRYKTKAALENKKLSKKYSYKNPLILSSFGVSVKDEKKHLEYFWENMEAASISYVCLKEKIPFSAFLCCTNKIGPNGRTQWKQNYKKAGELLVGALDNLVL